MGAGASAGVEAALKAAAPGELQATFASLPEETKAKLMKALARVKVYGIPPSQNAVSPILLAMELNVGGLEFVDLMQGAHKKPEYLAINPSGKIPGLEDGDVKIGESCAILRYLAIKYGPQYYPIDSPATCYKIDFAMDAFCSKVYPTHAQVIYPAMGFSEAPKDQAQANKDYGEAIAQWFKDHVTGKFVLGDKLSIADLKVLPFLFCAVQPGVKGAMGFTPADRLVKYCDEVCAGLKSSTFLKSAGGFAIAEFIASKTSGKSATATPAVQIDGGSSTRTVGEPGEAGKLKVHGLPASMNCVGPIVFAMETKCGAMQGIDTMNGGLKTAEYLAINPLGQMPAVEDGSVKGGESIAILRYMAMKYAQKYYPVSDAATIARIDYAMDDFTTRVYKAHVEVVYPVFGYKAMPEDKAAACKAYAEAMEGWASAHLSKGKFVTGDSLSIADFKAVPFFFCAVQPGMKSVMGLEAPARISKYCEDFCASVGSSSFMKEAGGWALAEKIAQKASA